MNITEALAAAPVSDLDLTRYVVVATEANVADTVRAMSAARRSCACVVAGDRLIGIFTQRDVLLRVVGRPSIWHRPITEEMTKSVRTMRDTDSVSDGLAVMNDWWVRSVPVLDGDDRLAGVLSYYVVMRIIARLVAEHIGDPTTEPTVQHSLSFVDFTGLNTSPPVTVGMDDTAEVAAHHMKARGIGSVLVVDDRERHLVGMLTEFDLQMRIGCEQADLAAVAVKDIMTKDPVALAARSPIVAGLQQMAEREFSHVPLLGESGRPVAVASFRDIATYVETSLAALS